MKTKKTILQRIKALCLLWVMGSSLTLEDLEIFEIQKALKNAGWQWEEKIFNDGHFDDCSITLTKSTDVNYLTEYVLGDCGWGRYSRLTCWKGAFKELI